MTPDNSRMPPLPPLDAYEADDWRGDVMLVSAEQANAALLVYGRQVAQMCAEMADDVDEPPHYGYENQHTFDDGKRALAAAIHKRFGLEKP